MAIPDAGAKDSAAAGDVLRTLTAQLRAAGIDTPGLDARRLLEAVSGRPREEFITAPERTLTAAQLNRLAEHAARRLAHEPVSRILGVREFWGRAFAVTPDTLDPRPDSETLIAAAMRLAGEEGWAASPRRILDLGTGTGCLLLTLLAEWPQATGVGIDISPSALAVARANGERLGLEVRASWFADDMRAVAASSGLAGPFDLVISNPPYIPTEVIDGLAAEVRLFDPRLALDGGGDGLDFYRAVVAQVGPDLAAGWVIVEIGHGQAEAVVELIRTGHGASVAGTVRLFMDLGGHTRCVAWKPRS